jgi:hypothetical protein
MLSKNSSFEAAAVVARAVQQPAAIADHLLSQHLADGAERREGLLQLAVIYDGLAGP